MEDIINQFNFFIENHPEYGYLIAASLFLLVLIGIILDWDWVVEPGGGYINIAYYIEMFGRKTVRLVYGIIILIGTLACLYGFYSYNPELY